MYIHRTNHFILIIYISQRHNVNLLHIESRASSAHGNHDFLIRADNTKCGLPDAIAELKKKAMEVQMLSRSHPDTTKVEGNAACLIHNQ
jgi:hypothetical protein